jgi:hypothetical protein
MTKVVQRVGSWSDWPADVVDRLRDWNLRFLLSFDRFGDFRCVACGREIVGHPNGNARIRPTPKAHGVLVCEDCLIRIGREHETPPDLNPARVALLQERHRHQRLAAHIERLEAHRARLRRQIARDQLYIDELEARVTPEALQAARAAMRNVPRGGEG